MFIVTFDCKRCGLKNIQVEVRPRKENENLKHWFDKILLKACWQAHTRLSLFCETTSLQNLKIPVQSKTHQAEWLGQDESKWPLRVTEDESTQPEKSAGSG